MVCTLFIQSIPPYQGSRKHTSIRRGCQSKCHSPATTATTSATLNPKTLNPKILGPNKRSFKDANFPLDPEGRTYHLGCKRGEVAPRLLSVGSEQRALLLASFLSPPTPSAGRLFMLESTRGFLTITGRYNGVPVSIVSTMMGTPNLDFVVREHRAIVDGQMAIVRLGTCGALQGPASLGSIIVSDPGSVFVRRNPDAFHDLDYNISHNNNNSNNGNSIPSYMISRPVKADEQLAALIKQQASLRLGTHNVVSGLNATADSFYASQGRHSSHFEDRNDHLLSHLLNIHPNVISLEMETFQLLDLARCSRGSIVAAAAVIALADRQSNDFIQAERIEELEREAGQACLEALVRRDLDSSSDFSSSDDSLLEKAVWSF